MQQMYPSLARAVETGPSAHYVSEFRALEKGGPQMAESLCPPGSIPYSDRPEFTLTCFLRTDQTGHYTPRRVPRRYRAGDFEIAEPRTDWVWHSEESGHFLNLALPEGQVRSLTGRRDGFGDLHHASFRCPTLAALVQHLWQSLAPGRARSRLLCEGLHQAVIGQLALLSGTRTAAPPRAAGLHKRVMAEIDARITETPDGALGTRHLAALAGMSQATFTRRFKATTGQSLHQYVITRRLERAQEYLRRAHPSIAEVAFACGFASQSHMTDAFRKKLGTTPAAYRTAFN